MIAEILVIGDEILAGDVLDTNTQYLSELLWQNGIAVEYHSGVRDDEEKIAAALRLALTRSDVILVTGGLGPTADDFTIEVAAKVFGVDLVEDEGALNHIKTLMANRGRTFSENNRKQAFVPRGGTVFINTAGTAPGSYFCQQGRHVYFLPGVPREVKVLFENRMLPHLLALKPDQTQYQSLLLRTFGATESELDRALADVISGHVNMGQVRVGFRFSFPEVFIKLSSWDASPEVAQANLAKAVALVEERIGRYVYAHGRDKTLEGEVVRVLTERGKTIALAESCTGGHIADRLTNVSGASQIFLGGITSYDNSVKTGVLGVSPEVIAEHGAVSEACAKSMVQGITRLTKADYAAAVTGIAGPTGGTPEKPVGTVYIATLCDGVLECRHHVFTFPRAMFKELCASVVLKTFLSRATGMSPLCSD